MQACEPATHLYRIRFWLAVLIAGLVISGVTAFPLRWEVELLRDWMGAGSIVAQYVPPMSQWIEHIHTGVSQVDCNWPFIFYGTDWLAFAHLIIAGIFIGPWRNPIRNKWVIQWGMGACAGVIPLALICGPIRGIPFFWQLLDCSFGVFGVIPLLLAYRHIRRLEQCDNTLLQRK